MFCIIRGEREVTMKIFASDYDGTIKIDGKVSLENIEKLKKWKEEGNHFGIVTGRSSESMFSEISTFGYELDFLVCNNGGVIYDGNKNLLKSFEINFEVSLELMEEIKQMDVNCFVLNDGYYRARYVVNDTNDDFKYGDYSSEHTIEEILEKKKVCQIVISVNDDEYAKQIAGHINTIYKGKVEAYPNVNCVDVVPYQVSKATGVRFIQEYFGYNKEDIYVMGDALNDASMLDAFQGCTLTHGFDELKKEGTMVCDDVAGYLKELLK